MADTERDIDRLYELAPEEFVEARDALAKRLRDGGDKDIAREVKSLRRPSVAAWAVNQLVRERPKDLERLLEAGAALREAHARALAGKKVVLREPGESRRSAVAALMEAAEELLTSSGRDSAATREAVESTLEAAAVDEDAAETVRAGRLTKELAAPAGFGAALPAADVADTDEPEEKSRKELERAARRATDEANRAEQRARQARERAERLRRDADEIALKADEAERRAEDMEEDAGRLRAAADDIASEAAERP